MKRILSASTGLLWNRANEIFQLTCMQIYVQFGHVSIIQWMFSKFRKGGIYSNFVPFFGGSTEPDSALSDKRKYLRFLSLSLIPIWLTTPWKPGNRHFYLIQAISVKYGILSNFCLPQHTVQFVLVRKVVCVKDIEVYISLYMNNEYDIKSSESGWCLPRALIV